MEILKRLAFLIFLFIVFLVISSGLKSFVASNTFTTNNEGWYDSAHYLNEYYAVDSGATYNLETGYQYYLEDFQKSPMTNSSNLAYAGSAYYNADYNKYAIKTYTQPEYENLNAGYWYFKEHKSRDGFDEAWEKYVVNN